MSNNNNELMTVDNFLLPDLFEGDFTNDELEDDGAGLQMSFTRIKIPSGGELAFKIPSDNPERPDYVHTLTGVILYNHSHYAYWENSAEDTDENTPPDCFSVDGISGVGNPGEICADCPMNQWGTGPKNRGKACKNMRVLYLLQSGDLLPIQFTLPPTSIKPYTKFYNEVFKTRRRATYGSVVEIGLKCIEGDNDYSVATFKKLFDFDGEKLAAIKEYTKSFKEQVKLMLQQRASEVPNADDIPYAADWNGNHSTIPGDSDDFDVSSPDATINGDFEELPA